MKNKPVGFKRRVEIQLTAIGQNKTWLAHKVGINQASIYHILRSNNPWPETLGRIIRAINQERIRLKMQPISVIDFIMGE